jgi:hypothetical protein
LWVGVVADLSAAATLTGFSAGERKHHQQRIEAATAACM